MENRTAIVICELYLRAKLRIRGSRRGTNKQTGMHHSKKRFVTKKIYADFLSQSRSVSNVEIKEAVVVLDRSMSTLKKQ